jgi:peptide/nickel transport system permease protein
VNTLIVQATVAAPGAIIGEAVLSYLGLGIQPPTSSLGVLISSAQGDFRDGPWLGVFPGVAILVVTLSLNLLGDGLRDALDPRETPR